MAFSAPVIVLLLLLAAKLIGVVMVGNSTIADFAAHDIDALHEDVARLQVFDVIEPGKSTFAAGDLAVLEGELDRAERQFADALNRISDGESCPVRINVELVRETMGDLATRAGNRERAQQSYTDALTVVQQAPGGCFAGNDDPNQDRRATRADSIPRLERKLANLQAPPATPLPPPAQIGPQSPPTSLTPTSVPPLPGLGPPPEQGPGPSPGPGPGPSPAPGPGPNMPQLPQNGGGQVPVVGPDDGGDGPGALDPVSPDRLPTAGDGAAAPAHRLGPGDPLDKLRDLLDNSNATGDNRE
ncbi:hypothetical protein [Mycolicibacterium aichiense]|uniref:Uncharacterized protein n=1 Tax=Mycolicibacterium aichiense TaxID=1799 RepID=A0AAD1MAY3_9MYCO|nr:hypothetical protein [Mycolicibacterium aichiense]MCV7019680.1 hypothetical protein [Mycolicibacterium aichiense]BBX06948.1 hypothetical protein MAIC_17510 [Mycolicibacterium aichiense]